MKNLFVLVLFILFISNTYAQRDKPPVFPGCEDAIISELENCFYDHLKEAVYNDFQTPADVINDRYEGTVNVAFVVTDEGKFKVIYVNSIYESLKDEVYRVFGNLPQITPSVYDGRKVDKRYAFPVKIPVKPYTPRKYEPNPPVPETQKPVAAIPTPPEPKKEVEEIAIEPEKETVPETQSEKKLIIDDPNDLFPEFHSELNIPFTHKEYDEIVYYLNRGNNTHTSVKPYLYNEVKPYVNLKEQREALLMDKKTWLGRKAFNEHLFLVKGHNYWFTANLVWDLQLGKDNSDISYTYNNTRGFQIQGALGKKFSFSTSFYESQGRFAQYVNDWTRMQGPIIGASAVVPGRGKAKGFKEGGFDYPVAEAYLSYTPNEFFNFQFGQGKNFIGDGYRSMFLSDVASPYPFIKISTTFWKIKYTNLWMYMDDVRKVASDDGTNLRKYVAMHHLSWNITNRLNLGLFEAVITNENSYPNGFDISFFNPIIFYRAIEFSNGGDFSGNVQVGLNLKYRFRNDISVYTQFLADEMTVSRVFDGSGYIGNKFAFQLGAKYYDAFKVKNLMLQAEYNWVRPYTYSHAIVELNAGHYNQPIAHMWGGNFWEFITIARYKKARWFGSVKLNIGKKGYDFSDTGFNYGGNIYRSYNDNTEEEGNFVGQGNTTKIFIGDIQAGWLLNPSTNLQVFGGFIYRGFSPLQDAGKIVQDNTTWFTFGVRSSLFNWYFDN